MARGFRMGGLGGGGQRVSYLAPINTLALTSPSNTAINATTKRTWVKNSYIIGLGRTNNYYASGANSNVSISGNRVTFSTVNGYTGTGVGFVLNDNVVAGETYTVDARGIQNADAGFSTVFYQSDGTYISYVDGLTFTVPSGTAYVVFLCRGTSATTSIFEINKVTKTS